MAEIIVVDDAPDVREMVAEALSLAGHAVRGAADGAALRRLVAERRPDLVVLDVALPGGEDGFRLARWLREHHDPVGVLMLTGAADTPVDRVVGLEVGADDHLAKPCAVAELRARVDAVLRRRGRGGAAGTAGAPAAVPAPALPEGVVPFGPRHRFDARRFVLTRAEDGGVVPLLEMELDLVAAFALHPGRALSRGELLRLAPPRDGGGGGAFERSIDNRIARLRRKLEADPARPALIKTLRGGGYIHPG